MKNAMEIFSSSALIFHFLAHDDDSSGIVCGSSHYSAATFRDVFAFCVCSRSVSSRTRETVVVGFDSCWGCHTRADEGWQDVGAITFKFRLRWIETIEFHH